MEQVEQMCDDICLFNNGKVVLTGNLRQVKKDFGKNTVLIEFEGDPGFLDDLDNVRINNRSTNFAEIRLLEGQNHQDILKKAMSASDIHKFQLVEPSLNEIFISTVGEDNIKNKEVLA
jgi:ABC-2 type transport system ATP-binding protein